MSTKMLYLAAALVAALPPEMAHTALTPSQELHGFIVHTTTIELASTDKKDVEAYNETLEAHYEAGWADTPTAAWENAAEASLDDDTGEAPALDTAKLEKENADLAVENEKLKAEIEELKSDKAKPSEKVDDTKAAGTGKTEAKDAQPKASKPKSK